MEAAQFANELRDCATGEKLVMLADGMVGSSAVLLRRCNLSLTRSLCML
jgi:hypothetical protein